MNLICTMFLILVGLLPSCASGDHKTAIQDPTAEQLSDLVVKKTTYEKKLRETLDVDGWLAKSCDALLFSSLFAASQPDPTFFKATAAEQNSGYWLRRPPADGNCTPTISKDMLNGLVWWAWRAKQPDVLTRLTDYGEAHGWVMGDPHDTADSLGKVVVTPALAGLMYQTLFKLGGKDHPSRHLPDVFPAGLTGFEAHLQVWGILLHGEVDDTPGVSDAMMARLKEHATANPHNPFYATALALYDSSALPTALALLNDETQWPKDGLPSFLNHCQAWPIQRDDGDTGWQPCTDGETDTLYGGDFVAMAALLTRGK